MPEYFDEELRGGIGDLRAALERLTRVTAAIAEEEPLRVRLEHELSIVARALDALDGLADEASQELL